MQDNQSLISTLIRYNFAFNFFMKGFMTKVLFTFQDHICPKDKDN